MVKKDCPYIKKDCKKWKSIRLPALDWLMYIRQEYKLFNWSLITTNLLQIVNLNNMVVTPLGMACHPTDTQKNRNLMKNRLEKLFMTLKNKGFSPIIVYEHLLINKISN
jgi:hypothetical protein